LSEKFDRKGIGEMLEKVGEGHQNCGDFRKRVGGRERGSEAEREIVID
jgi:hypothetical protein